MYLPSAKKVFIYDCLELLASGPTTTIVSPGFRISSNRLNTTPCQSQCRWNTQPPHHFHNQIFSGKVVFAPYSDLLVLYDLKFFMVFSCGIQNSKIKIFYFLDDGSDWRQTQESLPAVLCHPWHSRVHSVDLDL